MDQVPNDNESRVIVAPPIVCGHTRSNWRQAARLAREGRMRVESELGAGAAPFFTLLVADEA
jgi:hypothetical protein